MFWLSLDGRRVLGAKAFRSFAYGLLSVVLGLYLEESGYLPLTIGIILTLALAGSALLTAVMAGYADRLGRRRILILSGLLMIASGLAFALSQNIWLLALAALSGTVSATSGEVGPFETVEQVILPQTTAVENRNRVFGWYHTVGAVAVSLGSLAAAMPSWLHSALALDMLTGQRIMFACYSGLAAVSLLCISGLSPSVELEKRLNGKPQGWRALKRSRGAVTKLAALFGLDALGGGFVVQSLLAYWFALQFGAGGDILGPVFLGVNFMKAVSYPLAVRIANRFGLIHTMVFSHLPSNVLLILIPLMPNLELAIICLLARHLLAQMDVPARSSYIVAIVDPEERTAATGATTLVRTVTQSLGPLLAGLTLQVVSIGAPFFLGGGLKIVYDLALYFNFRTIRPPEEEARFQKTAAKNPYQP
ncbi:MAG: MFS transporter [Acidobacteria bacterium]|nr:MFS transporter [Acidobacteriota bacterium]